MTPDILARVIHREFPQARHGDPHAYGRMVAATQKMVASIALAVTRDVSISEDIAQETFLRGWQQLPRMSHPDSFLPWLRQVARNRAIDHLRALRYRRGGEDPGQLADPDAGPEQTLLHAEEAALLAQALDELPVESREILLLFYREDQSSRAVAALLGMSDAAVRKRLQRARDSLRGEVLQRLGEFTRRSAPGTAFTAAVAAGLSLGTIAAPATAAIAGAGGAAAKSAPKLALAALGTLAASLSLVLGAVIWEMRGHLRRVRGRRQRRAMLLNGIAYGTLMAGYMVALWWSARQGWSLPLLLGVAAAVSLAVLLLGAHRQRLLRRRHEDGKAQ